MPVARSRRQVDALKRARLSLAVLLALATASGAARHKTAKPRKGPAKAAVHASPRSATAAIRRVKPVATGNAELDRLLEERPAPESWTDSVLTTPAAALAAASAQDSAPGIAGETPLERLQAVSDPWIGTRYRSGGNGAEGFDCSGFVNRIYRTFGVELSGRSSPSYWTQGEAVDEQDLQPGDLVFFSDHTRRIGHVGIYLENGTFVHASVQSGVIVSAIEERYYRRRYKGARRIQAFKALLDEPSKPASTPR